MRGVRRGVDSTSRSVSSEAEPFVLDYDQLVTAVEAMNAETQRTTSISSLGGGVSSLTSADSGIVTSSAGPHVSNWFFLKAQ